jgi:hypoxanthine phosphoribosyltransferase
MKLPPVVTLHQPAFDLACAELMRMVEADYAPTLIIGIRTGGFSVAQSMAAAATPAIPVLPLTCRRATTGAKSRLPLLRTILGALPRPVADLLRQMEHRLAAPGQAQPGRRQEIDPAEVAAIAGHLAALSGTAHLLVADDAVDSGTTLSVVLRLLTEVCPAGSEMRTAVITQTLDSPVARPDYRLYNGMLCRFPWSFDAAA